MTKKRTRKIIRKDGFAYCLFQWTDGNIYLLLAQDEDSVIVRGWKMVSQAVHFFELTYQNARYLNFSKQGAALVDWMTYQPSICWAESAKWLQENVIAENQEILLIGSVEAQKLVGATRPGALAFWMQGEKPDFRVGGE